MINKMFGQEWSSDYFLAYNCVKKNGYWLPEEVINFCEINGKICRAEKKKHYQNKYLRTLKDKDLGSDNCLVCWSLWDAPEKTVKKVMSKFYQPYDSSNL
mgnify:CR=1 FL=1